MKRFFKRCDEHPIELTSAEITLNPDKVIDMLANLAKRITELERYADITRDKYERLSELERKLNHIQDEIDTLHANQRKLAEETTNRLDRHSERIRELAEMIGERKPYSKTFHDEELVKRLAAVLYQVLRDNERDGEER
jgi:predicted transcriptional regulator